MMWSWIVRIWSEITSRFGRGYRDAMQGARSAVWLFQMSDWQRRSAPGKLVQSGKLFPTRSLARRRGKSQILPPIGHDKPIVCVLGNMCSPAANDGFGVTSFRQ